MFEQQLDGRRFWVDVRPDDKHPFHQSEWKREREAAAEARIIAVCPVQSLDRVSSGERIGTLQLGGSEVCAIGGTVRVASGVKSLRSYEDALSLAVAFKIAVDIAEHQTSGVFAKRKE